MEENDENDLDLKFDNKLVKGNGYKLRNDDKILIVKNSFPWVKICMDCLIPPDSEVEIKLRIDGNSI